MPPKVSKEKQSCHECDLEVTEKDKALLCHICRKWYHIRCQRVTQADYEFLKKTDDSIQWFCKLCKGASLNLFKMITGLNHRQDIIDKQVNDLRVDVNNCNTKLDTQSKVMTSMKDDISKIEQNLPSLVSKKVVSLLEDKVEVEKREKNIIFFNIPESDSRDADEKFVRNLVNHELGVDMSNVVVDDITRLGSKPKNRSDKSRPLKITIQDRETRADIFKNAYRLKDADSDLHKKVGIGRDLTKSQREDYKLLKQKLSNLRENYPNKKWVIRGDDVVELKQGPGFPPQGDQRGGK